MAAKQDTLTYLKDPWLIARIQKFFGVCRIGNSLEYYREDVGFNKNGSRQEPSIKYKDELGKTYVINSMFWYYLFVFGATLGDEACHITFFPCWFWNVDSAVARRVVFLWVVVFTVGQALKDLFKWPRPACPPAVRLEDKWYNEYGMPSTHAMVGVAVPFSLLICTYGRYEYSIVYGIVMASIWTSVVCVSRFYLGMHTVADVVAGVFLSVILLIILLPAMDVVDAFLLTSPLAPLVMLISSATVLILHPASEFWTPTRGDTAVIVGAGVGVYFASWVQYEWGIIKGPPMSPPFKVMWPSGEMIVLSVLRTLIGVVIALITKLIAKSTTLLLAHSVFRPDKNQTDARVELSSKFLTYFSVGFNIILTAPWMFRLLEIHRPSMYTEV